MNINTMGIQETLQEKFKRLIINAPFQTNIHSNTHQSIISKFASMSLQDLHAKVQEITRQVHYNST